MKKVYIVLIALLLCGCQKVDVEALAVMVRDETDSALLLTLDENDNVIKEYDIDYPSGIFYQDNFCYYSYDGAKYKRINYLNGSISDSLEKVSGQILHIFDNNKYISVDDNCIYFVSGKDDYDTLLIYLYGYYYNNGYSYIIDSSNVLYIYNELELVNSYVLPSSDVMYLTSIDDEVYLISEAGVSLVKENDLAITYVYRLNDFEIKKVKKDLLYLQIDDEIVVYRMSFDELSLILTQELDDKYYRSHYLSDIFASYYGDDYYSYDYVLFY